MIVPMKKVSIIVMDKARDASLERLRDIGVIHVERKSVSSEALSKLLDRKNKAESSLGILRNYKIDKKAPNAAEKVKTIPDMSVKVLALIDKRKSGQEQLAFIGKERNRIEKWGEFAPAALKELADKGVVLIPYELSNKAYAGLAEDQQFIKLGKDKTSVYGLAVGKEIAGESPFALPELPLSGLDQKAVSIKKDLEAIEAELGDLAYSKQNIENELAALKTSIEFETARAGLENADVGGQSVSWLTGYAPAETLGVIKRAASENGWALAIDDPGEDDKPPTLVRNNAFVRLIQPLFGFLGTIPGYHEFDISLSYLLFFCLFFAMIFGDAAYGTLLLIVVLILGFSFKKKSGAVPDAVKLFGLLSCSTIVWGAITGTWFATPADKLPGFLRALIIPPFNNTGELVQFPGILQQLFNLPETIPVDDLKTRWNIEFLCFTVGLVQLVLAHVKNIIKLAKSSTKLVALAQTGWLIMMIGLYFLVLYMILQVALPGFATYFIGAGLVLYFVFTEQKGGNFFANIGKAFANFLPTFLNAVSSFADIISYIRLFAVGLAGSAIANSFNSMAFGVGVEGSAAAVCLKILAAILILVFGHSLNIVMNALSVIVHGVRLNLLEYAGNHLGMEWSGYAYTPFKRSNK